MSKTPLRAPVKPGFCRRNYSFVKRRPLLLPPQVRQTPDLILVK